MAPSIPQQRCAATIATHHRTRRRPVSQGTCSAAAAGNCGRCIPTTGPGQSTQTRPHRFFPIRARIGPRTNPVHPARVCITDQAPATTRPACTAAHAGRGTPPAAAAAAAGSLPAAARRVGGWPPRARRAAARCRQALSGHAAHPPPRASRAYRTCAERSTCEHAAIR